jgi:hypothetical protein
VPSHCYSFDDTSARSETKWTSIEIGRHISRTKDLEWIRLDAIDTEVDFHTGNIYSIANVMNNNNESMFMSIIDRIEPVRSSTNVSVSILFFDAATFDVRAMIVGDGNKPAFNITEPMEIDSELLTLPYHFDVSNEHNALLGVVLDPLE